MPIQRNFFHPGLSLTRLVRHIIGGEDRRQQILFLMMQRRRPVPNDQSKICRIQKCIWKMRIQRNLGLSLTSKVTYIARQERRQQWCINGGSQTISLMYVEAKLTNKLLHKSLCNGSSGFRHVCNKWSWCRPQSQYIGLSFNIFRNELINISGFGCWCSNVWEFPST